MFLFLKHPAVLASVALHGLIAGASYGFGAFEGPASRPALLLGVEACDVSGWVEFDPPPPPESPIVVEPIPDDVPYAQVPEESVELPPELTAERVATPPVDFDVVPVGIRMAARPTAAPSPVASPSTAPAPLPAWPSSGQKHPRPQRFGHKRMNDWNSIGDLKLRRREGSAR